MAFYLAVDAGGTKTDYVLADETRTLARARSGTIKRLRTDSDTAHRNLREALQALETQSGVSLREVTRTCIGTAGESVPMVSDFLREAFAQHVGGRLLLLGDVEIALDAAFQGGPGVLVLAGTGSNVAGRTPSGHLSHTGGWGPVLSDQGSGHAIGVRALRRIFLTIDEDRETLLQQAVLDFWQLPSIHHLVEYSNARPLPDFSRLAHLVVDCANQGDTVAREVLQREGEELAHITRLLIRRMRRQQNDAAFTPSMAFAGSIMKNVPAVRNAAIAAVQQEFPAATPLEGTVDPTDGALWRARNREAFEARLNA